MKLNYETLYDQHDCRICDKFCKNRRSLGNHLAKSHPGWDIEKYTLEYFLSGDIPKCACGCGGKVNWHKQRYQYNEFLIGHNTQWTSDNQPTLSQEQIDRRNDSIKKAYQKNGEKIKEKISKSVKSALHDSNRRSKLSKKSFDRWADPDYRKRVSEAQKKAWDENYEDRCKAVFTPEFGKKISLANLNRNSYKKSEQEKIFFEALQNALITQITPDHWVEWEGGAKCYDAFVPSWGLLIELDGIYWHGLDRKTGFTIEQVSNMSNDFLKSRIANQKGYDLIRIAMSDSTLEKIKKSKSCEDLFNCAYHVQTKDVFLKDGMFKFEDDNQALISRDEIIKWNESGQNDDGKRETEKKALPVVVKFFQEYFSYPNREWFIPPKNETINEVIKSINSSSVTIRQSQLNGSPRAGNQFLKSRMKSFWEADSGPAKTCTNKNDLQKVLSYRMGINNSKKYEYELETGEKISTHETFDISPRNIRNGFVVQRKTVSWFPPVIARDIWKWTLKDFEQSNPVVWDPSCGFGARLLGFISAYPEGTYFGTEPANSTFEDLINLKKEIEDSSFFKGGINLQKTGSECANLNDDFLDAVFTSPPYFDLEKYFDEPGQCWKDYPSLEKWIDGYLSLTLDQAWRSLKVNGRMALNVSLELEDIVRNSALEKGFFELPSLRFPRKRDHFSKKRGISEALGEPVLIFLKPKK